MKVSNTKTITLSTKECFNIKVRLDLFQLYKIPRRKLKAPTDKPVVTYCNRDYYLINTAKLQAVDDLTLIVGINRTTGKQLLKNNG